MNYLRLFDSFKESIEPVAVFAGVQQAHERLDRSLPAEDGQDLFTDTSTVFANDRYVQVTVGECERVQVKVYGEKCCGADALLQPLLIEARSGACPRPPPRSPKSMRC
jgi:hypothetical protein